MTIPGKTIGIFGGGQLGRMTGISARKMGYAIHIFDPSPNCPAGQIADRETNAFYEDKKALEDFVEHVDILTYEFENIPSSTIEFAAQHRPLHPSANVLHTCQNREREKIFLRTNNIPHASFEIVTSADELEAAVAKIGTPCVLKTADFGYDGKGQIKLSSSDRDLGAIWSQFSAPKAVLEKWIQFDLELSVICARNEKGETSTFPVAENIHTNHILDLSIAPGRISEKTAKEAEALALEIANQLEVVGLIAVEMFLTPEGGIIVNELAPRPHNSGHYTFDGCITSQFEQHIRSICNLPLGSTEILQPTVMVNILGDAWQDGEPDWSSLLEDPNVKLHLYGKAQARAGRKMGHFCVMDKDLDVAIRKATEYRNLVTPTS
jgi:5-(carboxyamino)imidazole ribonucleotide synthase